MRSPVERHPGIDDALHIARARADRPIVADVGHQLSGKRDIAVTARFEHAAHTKLRVAFRNITQSRKLREISARADHRRLADATVKQIFRGKTRALHVIRCNVVGLIVRETRAHAYQRIIHRQVFGVRSSISDSDRIMPSEMVELKLRSSEVTPCDVPSAYVVTYTE